MAIRKPHIKTLDWHFITWHRQLLHFYGATLTLVFLFHACQPPKEEKKLCNIEEKHASKVGMIQQGVPSLRDKTDLRLVTRQLHQKNISKF